MKQGRFFSWKREAGNNYYLLLAFSHVSSRFHLLSSELDERRACYERNAWQVRKARKAEKAKKEEEKDAHAHDDSSAAVAQQREQEGSLEAQLQMQRLLIDVDSPPCKHGFDLFPEGHICDRFVRLDLDTCASSDAPTKRTGAGVEARVIPLIEAMSAVKDKYPEALHIFEDTAMN
eukprot:scaffold2353_cov73-Skeletonema_marinoi.AAC.4